MGFHEPEPTNDDPFESKGNDESDSGSEEEMNVNIIPGIMFTFVSPSEPESNIYNGHNGYVLILLEMECWSWIHFFKCFICAQAHEPFVLKHITSNNK